MLTTPHSLSLARTLAWVGAAHLAVLAWLWAQQPVLPGAQRLPVLSTRWVPAPMRADAAPPQAAAPRRSSSATPARAAAPPPSVRSTPEQGEGITPQPPADSGATPPQAVATEPGLRADSVQRAAREAARRPGLAELSDEKIGRLPVDAEAGLRSGMASAGRRDCLKGGDGGLGLLALPLLAFDAATGRCAK